MHIISRLVLATLISSYIASPSHSMSDASKALTIKSFKDRYEIAQKAEVVFKERAKANGNAQVKVADMVESIRKSVGEDIKKSGVHFAKDIPEWEVQETLAKLIREDHYVVNIWYENDKPFPDLYLETPETGFGKEFSQDFLDSTTKAIFEHYLGKNHDQYSVTLLSANHRWIGLQFLINDVSELESLTMHPMVGLTEHMGNFQSDIITID